MNIDKDYRSGFVSIIGKPNVGKSTILNKLIGEKLSIVTPKPQTTRHNIKGFYTDDKKQIIFFDTPGFLKPRYELHRQMMNFIEEALQDADVTLYVTDHHFPTDYDLELCSVLMRKEKLPKIAIVNKIDLIDVEKLTAITQRLQEIGFEIILTMSALQEQSFNHLLDKIYEYLPLSPPFYPTDDLSDMPVRFFAQEIIREQIFLTIKEEIPYSSTVTIERFIEHDNKIEIFANVWLERKTQRIIFIGEKGKMIKDITERAERELYKFLQKRVKLELWVKVKQNWRKKKNALKEFGY